MDYATSHIFFVATLGLFTVALFSLSMVDRTVEGARWFAASTLLDFTKTTLQGFNGYLPRVWTVMVANELNILSFFAMYMGLRWFVVRKPLRSMVGPAAVAVAMAVYGVMFLDRMLLWSFTIGVLPVLGICVAAVWMLLRNEEERFAVPALLTVALLMVQIAAVSYRVGLSLQGYSAATAQSPWADARWMYSMLLIMAVGYGLLLMYALFTVMEMYSNVTHVAGLDALTGSLNRRALVEYAARELERSERLGRPLAIVGVDLDHFKGVNDTHGHGGGDAMLCAFVALMKEQLRGEDVVARTGGEEFVLVLPGMNASGAACVADMLRSKVESMRLEYDGRAITMTVSAGVTERLGPGDGWAAMVNRADRLLYQAKSAGRNCVMLDEEAARHLKAAAVERFAPAQLAIEPKLSLASPVRQTVDKTASALMSIRHKYFQNIQ